MAVLAVLFASTLCALAAGSILGDADRSGKVDISDVTMLQKNVAKLVAFSTQTLKLADVNGDNLVNIKDATIVQKYVAGISVPYKVGQEVVQPTTKRTYDLPFVPF